MLNLFWLIAGHFIADYPLQTDFISTNKNPDGPNIVPWYYVLAAHAMTHAAFVVFATNSVLLGLFEFIAHFFIDYGKCKKYFGIHVDQLLHIVCKVTWWLLLFLI